jgi:hypothetical protein
MAEHNHTHNKGKFVMYIEKKQKEFMTYVSRTNTNPLENIGCMYIFYNGVNYVITGNNQNKNYTFTCTDINNIEHFIGIALDTFDDDASRYAYFYNFKIYKLHINYLFLENRTFICELNKKPCKSNYYKMHEIDCKLFDKLTNEKNLYFVYSLYDYKFNHINKDLRLLADADCYL